MIVSHLFETSFSTFGEFSAFENDYWMLSFLNISKISFVYDPGPTA